MNNPSEAFSAALDGNILNAIQNCPDFDESAVAAAEMAWAQKTKPLGSLGKLEELVNWMAGAHGDATLKDDSFQLNVFAGSHGVADEGVSAFPNEVNAQMVANFHAGGAGINALCNAYDIKIEIFDTGVATQTGNIVREEAMSAAACAAAFKLGWESVPEQCGLFAVGEMGIANTTIASAVIAAILGQDPDHLTGLGSGIDPERRALKIGVIRRALELHQEALENPWEIMRCLGGRELAAMAGAILSAASRRIPVMLDGVIATAAAALAFEIQPRAAAFCFAGHCSVEPGHIRILERYQLKPLLDLDMRLGEGTGAAVAMGVVRGALRAYHEMATFESAGVSQL